MERKMNNKKGSVGGIVILVLVLMIASAVGGAYGYSVLDGKMAVKDALKSIERVDVSDYDTEEAAEIQGYIDQATKDLETARSRKEVYDITDDFKTAVSKVKTKTEKELEEARRQVEEARRNNSNSNSGSDYDSSGSQNSDSYSSDQNGYESGSSGESGGITEGEKDNNGILSGIFGNNNSSDDTDDSGN
jgi:membrane-associated HD superfamily phosphohydrolase